MLYTCKQYNNHVIQTYIPQQYVDLEYEGNGLREYQIYNAHTKKWDTSMCDSDDKDSRCAKMDCHLQVRQEIGRGIYLIYLMQIEPRS
jgi:hypothetical protein